MSLREKVSLAAQMLRRRTAYRNVFKENDIHAHIVLSDLRRFCPTDATYGAGKELNMAQVYINIGRRQVLSRIQAAINMSDERINEIAEAELKEKYYGHE